MKAATAVGSPWAWRSEAGDPAPSRVSEVDDRLTADTALRRLRAGEALLYTGDYRNARQLMDALNRRLAGGRRPPPKTPRDAFRLERQAREREHRVLSNLLVALDSAYGLQLRNAPDVAEACRAAWGTPPESRTLVSLKTLQGILGAAEWQRTGVTVPGLDGKLFPRFGVFSPTRSEYVTLLTEALPELGALESKRAFDVGTGTGVLSFVLLQRGVASVVATDVEPRAVACATDNARRLGLEHRFQALERDGFPDGRADLVICNPPWIPAPPKTRLDRAVFDEDGRFLSAFLEQLRGHLEPGGMGLLFLSDLPELLGLRPSGLVDERVSSTGLRIAWTHAIAARHPKAKDTADPLHAVRSRERVALRALVS